MISSTDRTRASYAFENLLKTLLGPMIESLHRAKLVKLCSTRWVERNDAVIV